MGSRISKDNENDCINQINNINENNLDLSNIDRLQIKVLKEMIKEIKEVKEKKSDKIMYRLPVQICNYSLVLINNIIKKYYQPSFVYDDFCCFFFSYKSSSFL